MLLERAEYITNGEMHLRGGLDVLEHDQASIFKGIVDLLADCGVLKCFEGHSSDRRSERDASIKVL